jgi:hypothetical protein
MLHRKPRAGDRLQNVSNYREHVNDNDDPVWEDTGIVLYCHKNICWYRNRAGDNHCCIWRFREGLNKLFRIEGSSK